MAQDDEHSKALQDLTGVLKGVTPTVATGKIDDTLTNHDRTSDNLQVQQAKDEIARQAKQKENKAAVIKQQQDDPAEGDAGTDQSGDQTPAKTATDEYDDQTLIHPTQGVTVHFRGPAVAQALKDGFRPA